jgi:hypothetical protein
VCLTAELLLSLETIVRVSDCCDTKEKVAAADLSCLEYLIVMLILLTFDIMCAKLVMVSFGQNMNVCEIKVYNSKAKYCTFL